MARCFRGRGIRSRSDWGCGACRESVVSWPLCWETPEIHFAVESRFILGCHPRDACEFPVSEGDLVEHWADCRLPVLFDYLRVVAVSGIWRDFAALYAHGVLPSDCHYCDDAGDDRGIRRERGGVRVFLFACRGACRGVGLCVGCELCCLEFVAGGAGRRDLAVGEFGDERMTFSKEITNACKGVAVLMLLAHHLWWPPRPDDCPAMLMSIAYRCKLCVAIFLLLSGYGLAKSGCGWRQTLTKRIPKLFGNYWLVVAVFVPISVFGFGISFASVYPNGTWWHFPLQLLGANYPNPYDGFNPTW